MATFPVLARDLVLQRLAPPNGPLHMVLDTDTYNEIDDQFALVYAMLSPNLTVEAVYAAPFFNERSTGPADGMLRSYDEIVRVLGLLGRQHTGLVFRGSERYLGAGAPVQSDATADLIARARQKRAQPIYVVAIGAITNVASALLMAPDIIENIVVVWLGGNPQVWPTAEEFNLKQDVAAAQLIFNCGVPLVHVPCKNVAEHLRTTLPEMERYVKGRGPIGEYLYEIFKAYVPDHYARSKVLWDISAVAYLNNPSWLPSLLGPAPLLNADMTWTPADGARHPFREVVDLKRDYIFGDLFHKLEGASR